MIEQVERELKRLARLELESPAIERPMIRRAGVFLRAQLIREKCMADQLFSTDNGHDAYLVAGGVQ